MRLFIICLAALSLFCGCKGKDGNLGSDTGGLAVRTVSGETDTAPAPEDEKQTDAQAAESQVIRIKPIPDTSGDEMVANILTPRLIPSDAGVGEPLKTDRKSLVAAARKALKSRDLEEATAITETMLLIDPADAEALEIRGKALLGQGQDDLGLSDLDACCKLGRSLCCSAARAEKPKKRR